MTALKPLTGRLLASIEGTAGWSLKSTLWSFAERPVARVRVTPTMSTVSGIPQQMLSVLLLDVSGREVPVPRGGHKKIVHALRQAFPSEWWDRAAEYDIASGELRLYEPELPSFLRGRA